MKQIIKGLLTTILTLSAMTAYGAEFSAKGKQTEKIRLNGRVHAQFESLSTDNSSSADPHTINEFLIRRAYFGIKGTLTNNVTGEINLKNSSGSMIVEKALITVTPTEDTAVAFGYTKIPVGYEEGTSSSKIQTVERSIVTRYFTEQYDLGSYMAGVHVKTELGPLYFKGSVTNPIQGNVDKNTGATENELAVAGKLGIKGSNDSFKYDAGIYGARFGDETKAATNETLVYGAYADLKFGTISVDAEVMTGDFDNGATDSNPFGFYIMPAVKLNDSFDVVLRYANIDADNTKIDISDTFRRAPDGAAGKYDKAEAYYLGGNWYISGNDLKLTFGYEMADYEVAGAENADVEGFRTRLQILF